MKIPIFPLEIPNCGSAENPNKVQFVGRLILVFKKTKERNSCVNVAQPLHQCMALVGKKHEDIMLTEPKYWVRKYMKNTNCKNVFFR